MGAGYMPRTAAIGIQDFETIIENNYFYVDKTNFIREWWENGDSVTLITRPQRFDKTLNINMLERFFSLNYARQGKIFENLDIWKDKKYQELQGTKPVISFSFANVKENTFDKMKTRFCQIICDLYIKNEFLKDSGRLSGKDLKYFDRVSDEMAETDATISIYKLCSFMYRYYGKKVIILLDEYDTPMQEAYLNGYWDEAASFIRNLFNSTFKTNPSLDRAVMTGITTISKESIFSDINNIEVVTTTSPKYTDTFGFTQQEVSNALSEFNLSEKEEDVKNWYDGFTFGEKTDIYNPWSILNFLNSRKLAAYWANTSSNSHAGKLVREGSQDVKTAMENLLNGGTLQTYIDEQIVFSHLAHNEYAIWSLLLASGYLKAEKHIFDENTGNEKYFLKLTNKEVKLMFCNIIEGWFKRYSPAYNDFIKALLLNDRKAMNHYMNKVALATFSFFDTGNQPSGSTEPERLYHGFVLGLIVELKSRYTITSNRESGFGRYDVLLKPKNNTDNAIIMEFKVHDTEDEKTLEDTAASALQQIKDKHYTGHCYTRG